MVFSARFAARILGVDIEVLEELAEQMAPEDGYLTVIDSLDETAESGTAFTRDVLPVLLPLRRGVLSFDARWLKGWQRVAEHVPQHVYRRSRQGCARRAASAA